MPVEPEETSFEDPKLKAAVQRALGGATVPASLRARVESALLVGADVPLAAELRGNPRRSSWRNSWRNSWRYSWISFAAAAVLLIGVGLSTWFVSGGRGTTPAEGLQLPQAFAAALVRTHDHCCSAADHHVLQGVPDDDFRLMSLKLRESLGFPSLAAAAGESWTFQGASALCTVGNSRSAHLVFKKADRSLSVFSVALASQTWPEGHAPKAGSQLSNVEAAHPIISWVQGDVVYSIVAGSASGTIGVNDIRPIANRMRSEILAAGAPRSGLALASRQ